MVSKQTAAQPNFDCLLAVATAIPVYYVAFAIDGGHRIGGMIRMVDNVRAKWAIGLITGLAMIYGVVGEFTALWALQHGTLDARVPFVGYASYDKISIFAGIAPCALAVLLLVTLALPICAELCQLPPMRRDRKKATEGQG